VVPNCENGLSISSNEKNFPSLLQKRIPAVWQTLPEEKEKERRRETSERESK